MADARKAAANVLDAVVVTSNAVCDIVGLVGKTAIFGGNWMDAVLKKQAIALKVDNAIFEQSYVEVKAQELSQIRLSVEEWAERNPRSKELYELSLKQLRDAVADEQPAAVPAKSRK